MQDLSHPNILNVQEMVIGDNINEVYMVMDYIPYELGRVLHTIKADLTASEVKTLLYQLLSGLDYMHRKWYSIGKMNDSISSLEILNPVIYCIKMESSKSVTLVWLDDLAILSLSTHSTLLH